MSTIPFVPQGVIPATLLAVNEDFSINEALSRKHLRDCALVDGVAAVAVNGHASEVHACSQDEQERILKFSLDEVGQDVPIICGVYADGSLEAAKIAAMADKAGASALLVFPPNSMAMGGQLRPEMAITHYKHITDVTDLPIICFQYSAASNLNYTFETLIELVETFPSIRAIKDWSEPLAHERNIKVLQSRERPINVLSTNSSWLMASLSMGANGLLSGSGSVIAELHVALFRAIKGGDLTTAQKINEKIFPLAQAFYAAPFLDMHNRMKEALVMLGRLDRAVVRPPLAKLGQTELSRIQHAIAAAGIS